ncbi:MAG: fructosamine kinase family protein [Chloroflexota bacterium]
MAGLNEQVEAITGQPVREVRGLGGSHGDVQRVTLADGQRLVAKTAGGSGADIALEGWMLRYLGEHSALPVPKVLHSNDALLLMTYLEGGGQMTQEAEEHAAELMAALHRNTLAHFGLERDTLIGPLHQPNPRTDRWVDFFRDHRLLYMARVARDGGQLPGKLFDRVERLAGKLNNYLEEPDYPTLLHGDAWGGNIIVGDGRIAGFIDPAIYYGHPEIELAFTTLFSTFGEAFYRRYDAINGIRPGFWEERRDLYNLYPLLVHARLFGGGYVRRVEGTLRDFGV